MIFTDPFFLFVFLPLACAVFHLAGTRFGSTAALAVLFVVSMLFYVPWGLWMTALLLGSVAVNFVIGSALIAPGGIRAQRLALVIAGEVFNFAVLIFFKYHLFAQLLGTEGTLGFSRWAIPAGISFYTFHQAAFLADAYAREASVVAYIGDARGIWRRGRAFVRYSAFVTFFPQLVIGPITYLREFEPQVRPGRFGSVRYVNIAIGFTLIVLGLFKKVVIADHFGNRVAIVFGDAAAHVGMNPFVAWLGILAYYLQLYFDFSGYSDVALGLARLFGIRYPVNFFSPFKAVGIIDFYRRWHMTLTRVISRFLFSPLSIVGTRLAIRKRYPAVLARLIGTWVPIAINFEVIGLWHGAAWTYVLFGFIHGIWYVLETETRRARWFKRWRSLAPDLVRATLARMIFLAVMPATFALFRSDSLDAFGFLLAQLLGFGKVSGMPSYGAGGTVFLGLAIVYLLPNSIEFMQRYRPGIMTYVNESYGLRWVPIRWRPSWTWMAVITAMGFACVYYMYRHTPFLYQGF